MKFIFSILLIIGVCLLSYYEAFDALTLTGGWAWFGLLCILYFIGDVLCDIGNWIEKKRMSIVKVKGKRCELTDEELMKRLNEDNKEE